MKKRGDNSRKIKAILLFGLLLTIVLMLIVSTVGRQEFNAPQKFALELIGTAQYSIAKVSGYFKGVYRDYADLINTREENKRLREELQKFKATNNEYREAVATNIRLAKLLKLKESLPPPTLTAQIIGNDPSQWFKTITIDRGSSDGVKKGMPVLTVEGIVGQIINTSPHYSKILLANDPNSAIDALIQKTRVQGIIKGLGNQEYSMFYVLKNSDVQKGDMIVTSGLGGVFPKGLPIGTVSSVIKTRRGMFQKIMINPSVNFSQLEYLIIIMKKTPLAD